MVVQPAAVVVNVALPIAVGIAVLRTVGAAADVAAAAALK